MAGEADLPTRRLALTLGGLAFAGLSHLGFAPLWTLGALLVSCALRLLCARRGYALAPRWTLVVFVALSTLVILASFRTLNGLQAGTALLLAMGALKVQETRAPRDHAALVFIGYFLCLASLLHVPDLLRLVHALLCVGVLTAALLGAQRPPGATLPIEVSGATLRLLLLSLPLALVLFVFVPRLEGRFWALPATGSQGVTGISPEMNPGAIARLAQSDEPAFRVRFEGEPPPRAERYWRALVLEDFDGHTWRRPPYSFGGPPPRITPGGRAYRYQLSLEPTGQAWLPALDHLAGWNHVLAQRMHDDTWESIAAESGAPAPVTAVTNYEATSLPQARIDADGLGPLERVRDTKLPRGSSARAIALAATLKATSATPRDYIRAVLDRFHDGPYVYTLEPPPLGDQPVDEFLFDTHAGFCEHYASAFTVLMRAAGLPARVVIGYQGGDLNPYGGYLLVRASHAHAWSEVWLDGAGWLRVDPTAAIAPERIESGLEAALPAETRATRPLWHYGWALKAREAVDAVRAGWNQIIVGYSASQQASLLARLGWIGSPITGLALALIAGFGAVAALVQVARSLRRPGAHGDAARRAWDTVCQRLARAGCSPKLGEGPLDYAARAALALPTEAAAVTGLAAHYVSVRYGPDARGPELAAFIRAARRYRPRPAPRRPADRADS